MSCTALTGINNNMNCAGNFVSFTVTGSALFSAKINSGTELSFQINNFLSPPTL